MEVAFSGAVKLTDISDFVSPSQDCIVTSQSSSLPQQQQPVTNEPVKISLQDCLACSGCVTSAETVLLESQSTDEFLRKAADPEVKVVVSVSSQSRAALSVSFGLPPLQVCFTVSHFQHSWLKLLKCLVGFFRWMGVDYVMDMNSANDLSLLNATKEFIDRFVESKKAQQPFTLLASACPGMSIAYITHCTKHSLGWVCYAEKTHGEWCLPYLAKTCSAQACIGKLVKSQTCNRWGVRPEKLYHCTVMACFDKKLEAARSDFRISDGAIPEVTRTQPLIKIRGS